jgi:predicted nucleotidyltransferase component of viral defense system
VTNRPTRATTAGRAYLELRRLARARNRPTAELLQLYALEGFLARLPASPHAHQLVLKGGVLLAAFDARRPTKDVDLAARDMANDTETVRAAIQAVLEIELDDGFQFDSAATSAQTIREDDSYSGVRVMVPCRLASAKLNFHVDVNVGDPIQPAPIAVSIPRLLGGEPLTVTGYAIAMVLAEKIVTALQRGLANTRWRDFADIALLSRGHTLDAAEVQTAIRTVADHRLVTLQPLREALSGFATTAQPNWTTWRRRLQLDEHLPASFAEVLDEVIAFADPLMVVTPVDAIWRPTRVRWSQRDDA